MAKKVILAVIFLAGVGFAFYAWGQEGEAVAGISYPKAIGLLAGGLTIALASVAGALGQGRTASSAMEGLARNPGAQGPMFTQLIVSLALIESLVIYALIIAFMILGKVG